MPKLKTLRRRPRMLYTFDERFYEVPTSDGKGVDFYPSVTAVLGATKSNKQLEDYKLQEAEEIGREQSLYGLFLAGQHGKTVHKMIQEHNDGETLTWKREVKDKRFKDGLRLLNNFDDFEWKRFARYMQWEEEYQPEILLAERTVYSHAHRIAGTCDAVARIHKLFKGIYVCDWKISKDTYEDYLLQTAAYFMCLREMYPKKRLDGCAVLALGSTTIQGYKCRVLEEKETKKYWKMFLNRLAVFHDKHKEEFVPKRDLLPLSFPGVR